MYYVKNGFCKLSPSEHVTRVGLVHVRTHQSHQPNKTDNKRHDRWIRHVRGQAHFLGVGTRKNFCGGGKNFGCSSLYTNYNACIV